MLFLEPGGCGEQETRQSLAVCWSTRFERVAPVRNFLSFRGQRNFPGWWWAATSGELVGFESWLERDQIMRLDFSPQVVAFSAQPFWLMWQAGDRIRRHAPDLFARLSDGTGVVLDVRADDQIEAIDAEAFAATEIACEAVGWRYRRVGAVEPVLAANLRWLAGYRHPRCLDERYAAVLREAFAHPASLMATVERVGDRLAVLPTLFHLVWSGALTADLEGGPLTATTLIRKGEP